MNVSQSVISTTASLALHQSVFDDIYEISINQKYESKSSYFTVCTINTASAQSLSRFRPYNINEIGIN